MAEQMRWSTKEEIVERLKKARYNLYNFAPVLGCKPKTLYTAISRYAGTDRMPQPGSQFMAIMTDLEIQTRFGVNVR